jgi:hypothetical protein
VYYHGFCITLSPWFPYTNIDGCIAVPAVLEVVKHLAFRITVFWYVVRCSLETFWGNLLLTYSGRRSLQVEENRFFLNVDTYLPDTRRHFPENRNLNVELVLMG